MTGRGKADLHIHTSHSDGMFSANELLAYAEDRTDLDVIAVTDHDSLEGAWKARERWAQGRYRFDFVTGMEVTTIEGHLLALFIEDPVPCLRGLRETIEAIRKQGGLAIVPHPFTWLTRGVGERHLRRLCSGKASIRPDGIELTNGTPAGRAGAKRAKHLNDSEFLLAEAGGSDAHFLSAVGCGYTEFGGSTAEELRLAIQDGKTRCVAGRHPTLAELGVRQVIRQTYRGIVSTPRAVGWGPTAWSFVRRIVTVR